MKRTLLLTALSTALLFSNRTEAQIPGVSKVTKALPKVNVGVKVGLNMQQLSGAPSFKSDYKPGIVGGAFVSVRKNKIGVRLEGLVKTARIDVAPPSTGHINTLALDVPVLFEYKLISRLWLQVGPQFTDIISAKDQNSNDVKNTFNSSDISGVLGLEALLPLHLTVGARYILGFTDMNKSGLGDSWKNRSIQVSVGFRFL